MKDEVADVGSPSLIVLNMVSVDVKQQRWVLLRGGR